MPLITVVNASILGRRSGRGGAGGWPAFGWRVARGGSFPLLVHSLLYDTDLFLRRHVRLPIPTQQ